jgi:hypothetical protein
VNAGDKAGDSHKESSNAEDPSGTAVGRAPHAEGECGTAGSVVAWEGRLRRMRLVSAGSIRK